MSKKLGPSGSPGAKWKDLRELVQVAAFAHPKFRTGFWMEDVERRTLLQERFAEHCVVQYVRKNPDSKSKLDCPVDNAPAVAVISRPKTEEKKKVCFALFAKTVGECTLPGQSGGHAEGAEGFEPFGNNCKWKPAMTLREAILQQAKEYLAGPPVMTHDCLAWWRSDSGKHFHYLLPGARSLLHFHMGNALD